MHYDGIHHVRRMATYRCFDQVYAAAFALRLLNSVIYVDLAQKNIGSGGYLGYIKIGLQEWWHSFFARTGFFGLSVLGFALAGFRALDLQALQYPVQYGSGAFAFVFTSALCLFSRTLNISGTATSV